MDIGQLRTFLAVYRTGSVTRAAGLVHLTQPAVSLQIQALERSLGRRLFRRMPRGMEPTLAGHELARATGPHLDALEESVGTAGASEHAEGAVFLGGPSEFVTARILPQLTPLLEDGLRLRVFVDTDQPIVERLVEEELDFAVVTVALSHPAITSRPLAMETHVLVAAPEWVERFGIPRVKASGASPAKDAQRVADAVETAPLLSHGEDLPLVRPYYEKVFRREIHASAAVVANSLPSLLALTEAGVGVTVLPDHVCAGAVHAGRLVVLYRPAEPPRIQMHLAWRAGSLRTRNLTQVHDAIVAAADTGQLG